MTTPLDICHKVTYNAVMEVRKAVSLGVKGSVGALGVSEGVYHFAPDALPNVATSVLDFVNNGKDLLFQSAGEHAPLSYIVAGLALGGLGIRELRKWGHKRHLVLLANDKATASLGRDKLLAQDEANRLRNIHRGTLWAQRRNYKK